MKRQALERAASIVLIAAALLVPATASAEDGPAAARRTNRYGRVGSEIWIEAPRITFATGGGYRNGAELNDDYAVDIDLGTGVGFGFGVFFAISAWSTLEIIWERGMAEKPWRSGRTD